MSSSSYVSDDSASIDLELSDEEDVEDNLNSSGSDEEDYSDPLDSLLDDEYDVDEYGLEEEDEILILRGKQAPVSKPTKSQARKSSPTRTRRGSSPVRIRSIVKPAPATREKVKVAPISYEYPGSIENAGEVLQAIEDALEDLYPDDKSNSSIARCALFHITYRSFYPIEIQDKVEEIIRYFS